MIYLARLLLGTSRGHIVEEAILTGTRLNTRLHSLELWLLVPLLL